MHNKTKKTDYGYDAPQVIGLCGLIAAMLIFWCFPTYNALYPKHPWFALFIIMVLLCSALCSASGSLSSIFYYVRREIVKIQGTGLAH